MTHNPVHLLLDGSRAGSGPRCRHQSPAKYRRVADLSFQRGRFSWQAQRHPVDRPAHRKRSRGACGAAKGLPPTRRIYDASIGGLADADARACARHRRRRNGIRPARGTLRTNLIFRHCEEGAFPDEAIPFTNWRLLRQGAARNDDRRDSP
jgi:hypothetical protein